MLTRVNAKAVIYTNEAGVRIIARPCFECKVGMTPGLVSQASDLCKYCYERVWGK